MSRENNGRKGRLTIEYTNGTIESRRLPIGRVREVVRIAGESGNLREWRFT